MCLCIDSRQPSNSALNSRPTMYLVWTLAPYSSLAVQMCTSLLCPTGLCSNISDSHQYWIWQEQYPASTTTIKVFLAIFLQVIDTLIILPGVNLLELTNFDLKTILLLALLESFYCHYISKLHPTLLLIQSPPLLTQLPPPALVHPSTNLMSISALKIPTTPNFQHLCPNVPPPSYSDDNSLFHSGPPLPLVDFLVCNHY